MNSSMSIVVFSRVFYWFMTLQTLTHSISFNTGWRQWIRYSMIYLICNMLFCKNKNIIDKLTLHSNFIRLKRSFQVNYLSWVTCFIVKPMVHIYLEQVHCKDCFLLIAPYWESIAPPIFMIVVLDLTMELDFYSGEWGNTQGRNSPSLALLFIFSLWLALLSICMCNYHCFRWYAILENKTPAETFPKFPSVLRVIDRSDRSPPITAQLRS